jgi:hypothetical protein
MFGSSLPPLVCIRVHKTKKNKIKTIQRNWQHKGTQDEEKQNKNNPEKLAT